MCSLGAKNQPNKLIDAKWSITVNNFHITCAVLENEILDIIIQNGIIKDIGRNLSSDYTKIDGNGLVACPCFTDMHVHFREPGFTHKETIFTGSRAAYFGGYCAVAVMPNTNPVLDSPELIKWVLNQKANVDLYPVGAITKKQKGLELTDFTLLKKAGAIAVSDDGLPVENENVMTKALIEAEKNSLLCISHCEKKELIKDRLSIPPESEYLAIERDILLAEKMGARLHIAHVSTKQSVDIIRQAKKRGARITTETAPHYFSLTSSEVKEYGSNAIMNPPLREESDRLAVTEGLKDGTIDVIATDHAPHSKEEKELPANIAPFGIIGLETAFSVGYTYLVKKGHLTLEQLIEKMSINPAKILKIPVNKIKAGSKSDFLLLDLNTGFIYDSKKGYSKSENSPYHNKALYGKVKYNFTERNFF